MNMELKCQIVSAYRDFANRKNIIVLSTDNECLEGASGLAGKTVIATLKQWRDKRSRDANAYYWALLGKIADILKTSTTELHNQEISKYGQPEIIDGSLVNFILLDSVPWQELEYIHLKPTTATKVLEDGKLYRVYRVMRGSSTYDSKEMSILIDGVVSEAKELGIETMPPEELERMINSWQPKDCGVRSQMI